MNVAALRKRMNEGMSQEEGLRGICRVLRGALGVRDVRYNVDRSAIFVMSGPRKLRSTMRSSGLAAFLMAACRSEHRDTLASYLENADHWDGWESVIQYAMHCLGYKRAEETLVVPVPGSTLPFKSWSAAKRKWIPAAPRVTVRLCDSEPVAFGNASGPVLLVAAADLPPLMLTHGVSRDKLRDVERCGGFLWPSWALSWRVPPSYGDVVFVADAMVVPSNVRPTGAPDKRIYIAGTDIWSPTARDLALVEKAMAWELAGDLKWWAGEREREDGGWGRRGLQNDLVVQSAMQEVVGSWASGPGNDWSMTDRLTQRRALVRRMRTIFRVHADPSDPYRYPERDLEARMGEAPYPYAEAKVTGPVRISDIPLVVYPRRNRRMVSGMLDRCDFQGTRLEVDWRGPLHGAADESERRDFARMVTDAVLWWAEDPCHRGRVGPALTMEGAWRSTYSAKAWWISASSSYMVWQRGFCGGKDPGELRGSRLSRSMRDALDLVQRSPGRAGMELAEVIASLEGSAEYDGLIESIYGDEARVSEFRLSREDAAAANALGWFARKVTKGERVVLLDWSRRPTSS